MKDDMATSSTPAHALCCPLCGGATSGTLASLGRAVHHCETCDLMHVPDKWHLPPSEEEARYRLHENTLDNVGYVARFTRLLDELAIHASSVRRALDYGSGPEPVLVQLMRRRGIDAVGYDPFFSPRVPDGGRFDAIVSTETFEHFANPAAELRRILGWLVADGWLAVMTEFHPGPERFSEWYYHRDETHIAFYSLATMDWIAKQFSLRITFRNSRNIVIFQRFWPEA